MTVEEQHILSQLKEKNLLNFPSSDWPKLARFIFNYAQKRVSDDRIEAAKEYGGDL